MRGFDYSERRVISNVINWVAFENTALNGRVSVMFVRKHKY